MTDGVRFSLGLFVVFISLCLSAFFSLTETALTSISTLKAKHMQELNGKNAQILSLWLNQSKQVLASLLIANNLAIIFASVFTDTIISQYSGKSSIFIVTFLLTAIIVLFSEIIPKTFAKKYANTIVIPILKLYNLFYVILKPAAICMAYLSDFIQNIFLKKGKKEAPQITEEELEFLINIGEKEGVIAEQKHEMLAGIFELGDTVVREIMVHRIDLTAVSQSTKIIDVVDKFRETGLSRIPIYEDKIDNITGTIHVKDALFYIKKNHNDDKLDINQSSVAEIKREVMFVNETKPIDLLFQEMRSQKQQMAVVLDEYGGTSGVVTMEDIFEEIVGEIRDEFDNEEDAIRPTQIQNQFLVEGKIHIEDFCDFFDIKPESLKKSSYYLEFDTLGGLVLHHFGHIPKAGDSFSLNNITIEVVEVSKRRVRKVIARLNEIVST